MSRLTCSLLLLAVVAASAHIVEEVRNQCEEEVCALVSSGVQETNGLCVKYGFCDPSAERVNSGSSPSTSLRVALASAGFRLLWH